MQNNYIVDDKNNCWIWQGLLSRKGYGRISFYRINGSHSLKMAHRVYYEKYKGKIPKELSIDHLCRNRACVNPEHLEAVTIKENVLRGYGLSAINARKTHCKRGHEFTKENTGIRNGWYGIERHCLKCKSINNRLYRENNKKLRKTK